MPPNGLNITMPRSSVIQAPSSHARLLTEPPDATLASAHVISHPSAGARSVSAVSSSSIDSVITVVWRLTNGHAMANVNDMKRTEKKMWRGLEFTLTYYEDEEGNTHFHARSGDHLVHGMFNYINPWSVHIAGACGQGKTFAEAFDGATVMCEETMKAITALLEAANG